jgi:hypothetical protein
MRSRFLVVSTLVVTIAAGPAQANSLVQSLGGIAGGIIKKETGRDITPYLSTATSLYSSLSKGDYAGAVNAGAGLYSQLRNPDGTTGVGGQAQLGSNANLAKNVIGVLGAAGVPIPDELRAAFRNDVLNSDQGGGAFGVNRTVQADSLSQIAEVDAAQMAIDLVLGKEGQEIIAAERQATAQVAKANADAATKAQSRKASIDVVKDQSVQLALLNQAQQANYDEAVKTRVEILKGNQATLGLLEEAKQENWQAQVDSSAAQVGSISAGAEFAGLMDPSQGKGSK